MAPETEPIDPYVSAGDIINQDSVPQHGFHDIYLQIDNYILMLVIPVMFLFLH